MRIGIFGSASDPQCKHLTNILQKKGAQVVLVESQGLNRGQTIAVENRSLFYQGQCLDDVGSWYLRYMMTPFPALFEQSDDYYLFSDWFLDYTHKRERYGMQLTWMLINAFKRVPVVNPPEHGICMQLKPVQLEAARDAGMDVPESLLTNDPQRVIAFKECVKDVVYKPSLSGGYCHRLDEHAMSRLDLLTKAPVLFQECIHGRSIRVTVVGADIVSSVYIPSETLDYRADPSYQQYQSTFQPFALPEDLKQKILVLLKSLALPFAGIDFLLTDDGTYYFLEANSSPIFLGIEQQTGHPITEKMADLLLSLANQPEGYYERMEQATRRESFLAYTLPFHVGRMVGGFEHYAQGTQPTTDDSEEKNT